MKLAPYLDRHVENSESRPRHQSASKGHGDIRDPFLFVVDIRGEPSAIARRIHCKSSNGVSPHAEQILCPPPPTLSRAVRLPWGHCGLPPSPEKRLAKCCALVYTFSAAEVVELVDTLS